MVNGDSPGRESVLESIYNWSRRRRTFVQWSRYHSRFLFCPIIFGDTVKNRTSRLDLISRIHNRAEGALSSSGHIPIINFCSVRILPLYRAPLATLLKKKYSEIGSQLPDTPYIPLEKQYSLSGFFGVAQKSWYQRPWNVLQRTILMFCSSAQPRSHRYTISHWIVLDAPTLTTEPEAPAAVHGRI